MTRSGRRGPRTADELMAELEQDPDHQRRQAERREHEEREAAELREAERPLLADLAAAGYETDSVWNLYLLPQSREGAVPVLLDHLVRDHPTKVLMGIGNALADRAARPWWPQLVDLCRTTDDETVRDRLGAALAHMAVREHYDDLLALLADESLGQPRIYFVRPVHRIGNRIAPGQGRAAIGAWAEDAVVGREVGRVLAGRSRND